MTSLIISGGGQSARTRISETNEQRRSRLHNKKFEEALAVYADKLNQTAILNETIGSSSDAEGINVGLPDMIHLNPSVLAAAYYILSVLDIDIYDGLISKEDYKNIAIAKMVYRSSDPGNPDAIELTPGDIELALKHVIKSDIKPDIYEKAIIAYTIDIFQYAMIIVDYRIT
jgi:hypothetical protein